MLANQIVEIGEISPIPAIYSLANHRHRIVRVQGFQMGTSDLKSRDPRFRIETLENSANRILDEFDIDAIEFGKGLLVLSLNHHLRLRFQGVLAMLLDFLKRQTAGVISQRHPDPSLASL